MDDADGDGSDVDDEDSVATHDRNENIVVAAVDIKALLFASLSPEA